MSQTGVKKVEPHSLPCWKRSAVTSSSRQAWEVIRGKIQREHSVKREMHKHSYFTFPLISGCFTPSSTHFTTLFCSENETRGCQQFEAFGVFAGKTLVPFYFFHFEIILS